jgi:hypothetical protein
MGGSSSQSSSTTRTTNQRYQETRTNNQNLQGIYSPVAVPTINAGGAVTSKIELRQTDFGATHDAIAGMTFLADSVSTNNAVIANKAIEITAGTNKALSKNQTDTFKAAINASENATKEAVKLSRSAIYAYQNVNSKSIDAISNLSLNSLRVLSAAGANYAQQTSNATLGALKFANQATRSDVANSLDNLVKYSALAASAIAIAGVLGK